MPNSLATETSPYLLQHVNNPVDWYPWGETALGLAKQWDRPIFLSIGYSACHWCHVMEHESFENPEIARLMNQWFICIKVDREERPDLDQIYMNAMQTMTGSGGWPMSIFLTPQLKPFFGGTYWPPTARWGRPGFREILAGVHDAWEQRRDAVETQADELTQHVRDLAQPSAPATELSDHLLLGAMESLLHAADRVHGGFGSAPKFPHPMDLRLAMRCWKRFGNGTLQSTDAPVKAADVLDIVTLTLDKMARGGIYDHLGGGFARYSTDERWLVPHFEKMLYDNAQLVPAYLEAFQITGRGDFSRVARETLDYVLREMTQSQGGFFSTQDADSEGVEGKFFVWSEAEIDAVLSEAAASGDIEKLDAADSGATTFHPLSIFKRYYDVTAGGNWEQSNILNCSITESDSLPSLSISSSQLDKILADCRKLLFDVRSQRVWPGRDDKVIVAWNGLMIAAMSMGANVLGDQRYADAACAAADFILSKMLQSEASYQLWHCYKDGRARFNGYLDDYAALIDGLCDLYQTVFNARYLEAAIGLAERMIEQFWDADAGGFFYTSLDHESLIARNKETQDNATPSGNSLAVMGLFKLSRLSGRMDLEEKAIATLEMLSGQLERMPLSAGLSLMSLDFLLGPTHEIVIAQGKSTDDESIHESAAASQHSDRPAIAALHQRFIPNKTIHWRPLHDSDDRLPDVVSSVLRGKLSQRESTTAYFCQHGKCGLPVVGRKEITAKLEQM